MFAFASTGLVNHFPVCLKCLSKDEERCTFEDLLLCMKIYSLLGYEEAKEWVSVPNSNKLPLHHLILQYIPRHSRSEMTQRN